MSAVTRVSLQLPWKHTAEFLNKESSVSDISTQTDLLQYCEFAMFAHYFGNPQSQC